MPNYTSTMLAKLYILNVHQNVIGIKASISIFYSVTLTIKHILALYVL